MKQETDVVVTDFIKILLRGGNRYTGWVGTINIGAMAEKKMEG